MRLVQDQSALAEREVVAYIDAVGDLVFQDGGGKAGQISLRGREPWDLEYYGTIPFNPHEKGVQKLFYKGDRIVIEL